MSDDETDELSPEELRAVTKAWRELVEDKAHNGRLHYTMPPVRGMPAPGSFRIPRDVFEALGDGDLKVGGAIIHQMFGIEDDPEDPTIVHPHAVRIIGNGNINAGRRVLEKFVARVRRQPRNDSIEQPDGHSPDRVIR
jgi:hypothetical protein